MTFVRPTFLPFSRPAIDQSDIDGVVEVLQSGWITTGPKSAAFEEAFRAYTGAGAACALTSGTAGMHLALMALGIGKGDEVVTPSLTWGSTINLITLLGAKAVFADIDRSTLMVTPETVDKVVSPKTKAIIPVHYAGAPADLAPLRAIAARQKCFLIEDAAHALGTRYGNDPIGKTGTAIFSFHPIKNITTGEGGMVTSDDAALVDRVRVLKFHGLSKDAWQRYSRQGSPQVEITTPGFKYNLTDIQSSLGLTQLKRLDELNRRRTALAALYHRLLAGVSEISTLQDPPYPHTHSRHLYIVFLDLDRVRVSRDEFLEELKQRNIGTGIHFRAVHTQAYYRERRGAKKTKLPNTEWASDRLFSLPLFPDMTESDVQDVVAAIQDTIARVKR
jgi:UDP-4-amino-4-deoxy-L-arabinose-oxoglutarate aminotransferase